MTVLLVLSFICVFLVIDYLRNRVVEPDIYYHPTMAPTMCDGGVKVKNASTWIKLYRILRK